MKKILIVDSDEQVTMILDLKLRQEKFDVKTLSSTIDALKVVKEFKPDLIISEMVLPELTGVDFLKRVKMNPELMRTPFIFLSTSRNVEDKILAHEMGAEAFFMKPIFIKVLIHRIKDFFDEKNFNEMISLSKKQSTFKGDLTSISIIDILNIISENKSSGEVNFSSSTGEQSKIFFSSGSVIRIEMSDSLNKNGVDELYKLLSWLDGIFTINFKDVTVQRNINIPHDRLVVRAVSWLDDYSSELSEMPSVDSRLYLNFDQLMSNINKFPDNASEIFKNIGTEGTLLIEIIEKTSLDRKQTVKYLKSMMDLKIVTVEKKDTVYKLPNLPGWLKSTQETGSENLSIEQKKYDFREPEIGKTLVPPPSFARKDTLDPAVGVVLNLPEMNKIFNKEASSINIDIGILKQDEPDQKTEIVKTVQGNEEIDSFVNQYIKKDSEKENSDIKEDPPVRTGNKTRFLTMFLFVFFVAAVFLIHIFFPEKLREFTQLIGDNVKFVFEGKLNLEEAPVEIVENTNSNIPEEKKEESDEDTSELKEQSEYVNFSVSELIEKSAQYYEHENYEKALEICSTALKRLKSENIANGTEYEKVVTNMGIYLYSLSKNEEALVFAEESLMLKEDEKAIELKVAILEELKKPVVAASFLRSKINEEKFSTKKDEWMMEINRLEKINQ